GTMARKSSGLDTNERAVRGLLTAPLCPVLPRRLLRALWPALGTASSYVTMCHKEYPVPFDAMETALEWNSQRSCGCPWIPGSVQGQAGWGLEHCGRVEGVPAHGRETTSEEGFWWGPSVSEKKKRKQISVLETPRPQG
ncbi:unnamed protein product, partial [Coccothraustes coccothraustes]